MDLCGHLVAIFSQGINTHDNYTPLGMHVTLSAESDFEMIIHILGYFRVFKYCVSQSELTRIGSDC